MLIVAPSPEAARALAERLGPRAQAFDRADPPLVAVPGPVDADIAAGHQVLADHAHPLSTFALHPQPHTVRLGSVTVGQDFAFIGGPCSVESEDQILRAARGVQAAGAHAVRGGAFKPRTGPYAFQGHGEVALEWLSATRRHTGLPVVTEVLTPEDVELVAEHADALQVGTRSMQNTALLKALGDIRRPVILKRGFGNRVEELLSAAEYILARGNPDVILCERGVRTGHGATRFCLDVSAVAWLKVESRLPVLVDPSHAAGRRDLVEPLALAAAAAGADGLLIETHPHPDQAWSDAEQAIDLDAFARLVDKTRRVLDALGRASGPQRAAGGTAS